MKLFKITDQDGYTRRGEKGETKWESGKTVRKERVEFPRLCTEGVIHAYCNANIALLLNPIHANIDNPVIWLVEGDVVVSDWGKVGCSALTTIDKIEMPMWWKNEVSRKRVQVAFAALCANAVIDYFEKWDSVDKRPRTAINIARQYLSAGDVDRARAAYAADAAAAAAYAAAAAAAAHGRININFEELADQSVTEAMS